jgi:isoquinoline 1-oxidoreductase beta subunit
MRPRNPIASGATTRREFLRISGGMGIGLIIDVGFAAAADSPQADLAAAKRLVDVETVDPTGFVKIAPDDTVTVLCKHIEMGQGSYTGLATLVAEELDADWRQMRGEGAPANDDLYKNFAFGAQGTGGSTGMSNSFEQMRKAGATARAMLVAAAAEAWRVPPAEITVSKGIVRHASTSRKASFGKLAESAARQAPPAEAKLKDPREFNLIGRKLERIDAAAKSSGEAIFTLDMHRPDALTVVIAHPPRFGARAASFDDSAAKRIKGFVDAKVIPQGVAVYAGGFWAAKKAREALRVQWDDSAAEIRGTDQLMAAYRASVGQPDAIATDKGDARSALAMASRVIEAEYVFPYLAHAPMEPLDCAIELRQGTCEAWFGCQFPGIDHPVIAGVMGLPRERVKINVLFAGGSFGRRAQIFGEFAAEAAQALKALGRDASIKVVWTREDDIRGGFYRPMALHRLRAGLDASGNIVAFEDAVAVQSFIKGTPLEATMVDGLDPLMTEGSGDLAYAIPNVRVTARAMQVGVPVLSFRSVGLTHNTYTTETFIDELLAAGGHDAVAGRLALLKRDSREAGVLRALAKLAGWNGAKVGNGRARGVAVGKAFGTYVAQIAEVSRGNDGLPKVERVWCAIDCGFVLNPDNVKSQMEGGIGFGLGSILFDEITLDAGRVRQSNFNDYRMLRIGEMPRVDVTIVDSNEKPTGVGEPGVPCIGPAVANAWRVLTGRSVRHLPFTRSLSA